MTREEIESVYSRDVLDRNWWGNFPEPLDLLGKDFPKTADIYRLMPVCARIALHMGGELPRIIFSKEGGARMDFNSVVMNPEILSLKVSEQVRAEVFFGQYIHQVGHICYSRGVYEKYRCTLQQKYFIHLIEDRRIEGRIARVYPGYYYYLNAARRMQFTLALLRAEQELKFTDLDDVRYNYCMVGYRLGNTVTDNGSVSRGVCQTNGNGYLSAVVERTRIEKYEGGIHFTVDEGATWEDLSPDTLVSMNMWGFTPSFLREIKERFPTFLEEEVPANPLKAEMFLPMTVGQMLGEGIITVKVLPTTAKWYGVTYAADKPVVVNALQEMTRQGLYPDGLWG